MTELQKLIQEFCPNGVEFKPIKEVYLRLRGTPITAGKMKEIEDSLGEIRIFAGGKTVIPPISQQSPSSPQTSKR